MTSTGVYPSVSGSGSARRRIATWRPLTWPIAAYIVAYVMLLFVLPPLFDLTVGTVPWRDWSMLVNYSCLAVVGVWVFRRTFIDSWGITRRHPWKTLGLVAFGTLSNFALSTASALLFEAAGPAKQPANQSAVQSLFDVLPGAVMVPTVVVLGPLVEELVFRETLLARLRRWMHPVVGIPLSAIVFGAIHLYTFEELPALILYVVPGLVFAIFFVWSRRNLFVSFAIHLLTNAVALYALVPA